MSKKIIIILVFTIIGLVTGYLLFGKIAGEYVDLTTMFSTSGGELGSFGRKVSGISKIRNNILIAGGAGLAVGFIWTFIKKK